MAGAQGNKQEEQRFKRQIKEKMSIKGQLNEW